MIVNLTFDPILAQIGPVAISWQGIFTALALALAIGLSTRNAERRGISVEESGRLVILTLLGGVVFGRLANVLAHTLYYVSNPTEVGSVWDGGMSLYGALLGGALVLYVASRRARISPWTALDATAPAALAGVAVGRVGCLLSGSAWGTPTGGAWGVIYWHPDDVLPPNLMSIPLHPYPLYESSALLLLFVCLWQARRIWPLVEWSTFLLAGIGYAIIRFGLAGFRPDPMLLGGLQPTQIIALISGIAFCLAMFSRSRARIDTRNHLVRAIDYRDPGGDESAA